MPDKTLKTKYVLSALLMVVIMAFISPSMGIPLHYLFEDKRDVLIYSIVSLFATLIIGGFIPLIERNLNLALKISIISTVFHIALYFIGIYIKINWLYVFFTPFLIVGVSTCLIKKFRKESILIFVLGTGYSTFHIAMITAPFLMLPPFLIALMLLCGYKSKSRAGFAISIILFHLQIGIYVLLIRINQSVVFIDSEQLILSGILALIQILAWYYLLSTLINSFYTNNINSKGFRYYTLYIPGVFLLSLLLILLDSNTPKNRVI